MPQYILFFDKDLCFYKLMTGLHFSQDALLKTCIIPQQSFKMKLKYFFWRSFTPKTSMLYIFPALLFILKDLFLIRGILENYPVGVSGFLGLSGIRASLPFCHKCSLSRSLPCGWLKPEKHGSSRWEINLSGRVMET